MTTTAPTFTTIDPKQFFDQNARTSVPYVKDGIVVQGIRLSLHEFIEFKTAQGDALQIPGGGVLLQDAHGVLSGMDAKSFHDGYRPCLTDGRIIAPEVWEQCYAVACDDAKEDWHLLGAHRRQRDVEHTTWAAAAKTLAAA